VVGRGDEDARLRLARFSRLLPRLLAGQQRPLRRADLRYTNGFALSWGEKPGIGNRESGIDQEQQQQAMARQALIPASPPSALVFPIPHSPFPIPGRTT
jgi:cell division protein FtsQ